MFTERIEPDGSFTVGCDLGSGKPSPNYHAMADALQNQSDRWIGHEMRPDKAKECRLVIAQAFVWFGSGTLDGRHRITWQRISTAGGSAFLANIGPIPRSNAK